MDRHLLAEERSIAMHAAIAAMLREDPSLIERARQRVSQWRRDGGAAPFYAAEWERILSLEIEEVCRVMVDPAEPARALRQVSPFAGYLPPRQRWRIWREVRDRMLNPPPSSTA